MLARHFSLADDLILLTADGKVAQHGSSAKLDSKDILEGKEGATEIAPAKLPKPSPKSFKPPPEKMQDLMRRTGDFSLYTYYFRTVDPWHAFIFISTSIAVLFGMTIFPPLWLKLWTDDNGQYIGKYISVYMAVAVFSGIMVGSSIWQEPLRLITVTAILILNRSIMILIAPTSAARLHYILLQTTMRFVNLNMGYFFPRMFSI